MAWASPVTSARLTVNGDGFYEAFHDGTNVIVIQPNPREICQFTFSIASEVGEADNLDWQILGGHRIIQNGISGTITSTTVFDVAAADNQADDYYMGMFWRFTSGGETADLREIENYVSSTDAVTVVRALSGTPTITETYDIYHLGEVDSGTITAETTLTEDLAQHALVAVSGYPLLIARARATGSTDTHIALMTYALDGVSA